MPERYSRSGVEISASSELTCEQMVTLPSGHHIW